jgi:hypothetical protein
MNYDDSEIAYNSLSERRKIFIFKILMAVEEEEET